MTSTANIVHAEQHLFHPGTYVMFPSAMEAIYPLATCMVFAELLNEWRILGRPDEFSYSIRRMQQRRKIGEDAQRNHIKALEERGFIETRVDRSGEHPARVFAICWDTIGEFVGANMTENDPSEDLGRAFPPRQISGCHPDISSGSHPDISRGALYTRNKSNNNTNNVGSGVPPAADGSELSGSGFLDTSGKPESKEGTHTQKSKAHALVEKLHGALVEKRLLAVKPNLKKWTAEMEKVIDAVGEDEAMAVLDWYVEHIGESYTPVVLCAAAFRAKFGSLSVKQKQSTRPRRPGAYVPLVLTEEQKALMAENDRKRRTAERKELEAFVAANDHRR